MRKNEIRPAKASYLQCVLDFLKENKEGIAEQMLMNPIMDCRDNYYGEGQLVFGTIKMDVESIWCSQDDLYIHLHDTHFEGDVLFTSLSMMNWLRVLAMIKYHD